MRASPSIAGWLWSASSLVACAHASDSPTSFDESFPTPTSGRSSSAGGRAGAGAGGSLTTMAGQQARGGAGSGGGPESAAGGEPDASSGGASGDPDPVDTGGAPAVGDLQALYRVSNLEPKDNQIGARLAIENTANSSVSLSSLELRYYFTNEVASGLVVEVSYAEHTGANYRSIPVDTISTKVVALPTPSATSDSYVQIDFAEASGLLEPDAIAHVDLVAHKSDWSESLDETNDYSFSSTQLSLSPWSKLVLLQDGVPVWGSAP